MSSIKNKINKLLFEKIETDFHNDTSQVSYRMQKKRCEAFRPHTAVSHGFWFS